MEDEGVNLYVFQVMVEIGVGISSHRSKDVDEFLGMGLNYVVTVCDHAKQICPLFPGGKKVIHRGFEDPAAFTSGEDDTLAMFRRVRDEIRSWIEETFGKEGE